MFSEKAQAVVIDAATTAEMVDPSRASAATTVAKPAPAPDPFDPAALKLSQDFASMLSVKKALLSVPVRKPAKEWWVRAHNDPAHQLQTIVLELKEENETYLIAKELWPALQGETTVSPRLLITAVNAQGVVFIWPIRLPGADGKLDRWSESAMTAADMARDRWTRVQADLGAGGYQAMQSDLAIAPAWPDLAFAELLKVAFKGRYIDRFDHPVLKRLRGEA